LLTVSPFDLLTPPQPAVYSRPFDFVGPLFSYSYGLFVVPKTLKSFAIKQIQTLCAKYRGVWGISAVAQCTLRLCVIVWHRFLIPLFSGSYKSLFPQPLSFHIYTNLRGVCGVFLSRVTGHRSQVTSFHLLTASLWFLCALFRTRSLCFQELAASFPKIPGGGIRRSPRSTPRGRGVTDQVGRSKATELVKVARKDGDKFDCATWLHKAKERRKRGSKERWSGISRVKKRNPGRFYISRFIRANCRSLRRPLRQPA
jgi:hypothetical protein